MSITGPNSLRGDAPHLAHFGLGGTTLQKTVATCTGPPQFPHVPIVLGIMPLF
jgi:hypothetical protein